MDSFCGQPTLLIVKFPIIGALTIIAISISARAQTPGTAPTNSPHKNLDSAATSIDTAQAATDTTTAPSAPFVSISGTVTTTADLYSSTATPDSAQKGRRPKSLYRVMFSPTVSFGEFLSIPFNIVLTTPETNTTTPSTTNPTFWQFVENPANALGFSSINPKIGWASFSLGSYTPTFSALTSGDQQLFGGGFDLTPGKFRFAASAGISQRAIEPNAVNGIAGAYQRDLWESRLSYGNPDSSFIALNFVFARDQLNSLHNRISTITPAHLSETDSSVLIPADTIRVKGQEGIVASTDFKLLLSDAISWSAEAAVSSFTSNESMPGKDISGNYLKFLLRTLTSTRGDIAGTSMLAIQTEDWGVNFTGLYMGAGFVSLAYAYTQPDRLEFSVSPSVHLFDSKVNLSGTVGERVNNLSKTLSETSTQITGSANLDANLSDAFSLSAQYSNFGIHNDQTLDTLRVMTVAQSLSINPTLTLAGETVTHSISASASIDDFKDYNTISGAMASNNTRTILGSYSATFDSIPLSVALTGSYMENLLATGAILVRSISATIGYAFFDLRLQPSLSLTASNNSVGRAPIDEQAFFKVAVRWRASKSIDVTASLGKNNYTYGDPLPQGSMFQELLFHLVVSSRF